MTESSSPGIQNVALTVQVTVVPERLDALLTEADKHIGQELAKRMHAAVQAQQLGYYPAPDYFAGQAEVDPWLDELKRLAAQIRKRVKRDVQLRLWPVFSSVRIERVTTLAFNLPRVSLAAAQAQDQLAAHLFPGTVRLELVLSTFDKQRRLENVETFTEQKVVRNLRDTFAEITVSAARRVTV